MSASPPVPEREPALWRVRLADLRGRGVYAGTPDKFRCIFIHIPKTAGSSVAETLFGSGSRHVGYQDYLRANPRKFRSYFKFAFVRDPWDRLVSTWFFLKKGGMNARDRAWAEANLSAYESFEHFACEGFTRPEVRAWVHFRPQADFIATPRGELMVDFVGRYETLANDFAHIAARLGSSTTLAWKNSSGHEAFASYYTERSASVVANFYERDAKMFGYSSPILKATV